MVNNLESLQPQMINKITGIFLLAMIKHWVFWNLSNVVKIMISKRGKYIIKEEEKPVKRMLKLLKPRHTMELIKDSRSTGRFLT